MNNIPRTFDEVKISYAPVDTIVTDDFTPPLPESSLPGLRDALVKASHDAVLSTFHPLVPVFLREIYLGLDVFTVGGATNDAIEKLGGGSVRLGLDQIGNVRKKATQQFLATLVE